MKKCKKLLCPRRKKGFNAVGIKKHYKYRETVSLTIHLKNRSCKYIIQYCHIDEQQIFN
jgi:hypothetical protein